MEVALNAGAEDIKDDGSIWEVVTTPEAYEKVLEAVKGAGIEIIDCERRLSPPELHQARGQGRPAGAEARRGARRPRRHPDRVLQLRHRRGGNRQVRQRLTTATAAMRVLGIDPSSQVHGIRDYRIPRNGRYDVLAFGTIKPKRRRRAPRKTPRNQVAASTP